MRQSRKHENEAEGAEESKSLGNKSSQLSLCQHLIPSPWDARKDSSGPVVRFIILCSVQAASATPPPPHNPKEHPVPLCPPNSAYTPLSSQVPKEWGGAVQTHILHKSLLGDRMLRGWGGADEGYKTGLDGGSSSVAGRMRGGPERSGMGVIQS